MKKPRNSYAIPFYLRTIEGDPAHQFVDTPVGQVDKSIVKRIHMKFNSGVLNFAEAAAELRRTADYIDQLAMDPPPSTLVRQTEKLPTAVEQEHQVPVVPPQMDGLLSALVEQVSGANTGFAPEFKEYLETSNPFCLTENGTFNEEQRNKWKPYCFIRIKEIHKGFHLVATKMANDTLYPITIISPKVDLTNIKPGPAVALADGKIVVALVNIPEDESLHLSRTFNSFYRA